jgi:hypothetical protein
LSGQLQLARNATAAALRTLRNALAAIRFFWMRPVRWRTVKSANPAVNSSVLQTRAARTPNAAVIWGAASLQNGSSPPGASQSAKKG